MKLYVTDIIKDDYKNWKPGDHVKINAAMGSGKTRFILNTLSRYAEEQGKFILFLSNRTKLLKSIQKQIDDNLLLNVTATTYQSIETKIENSVAISKYDYIVCDEAHYFLTDSWNDKTFISYKWIKDQVNSIRIFMTATGEGIFKVFDKIKDINKHEYTIAPDYSYIKSLTFFDEVSYVDEVIANLGEDEKLIYFCNDLENAKKFYEKYNDCSSLVCSKHTNNISARMLIDDMALVDDKLRSKLTFTTSVLDNGIEIKDGSLKHIVIDIRDLTTLIQCLGRKRIAPGETVHLYIKNWNRRRLTSAKNWKGNEHKELWKNLTEGIRINGLRLLALDFELQTLSRLIKDGENAFIKEITSILSVDESRVKHIQYEPSRKRDLEKQLLAFSKDKFRFATKDDKDLLADLVGYRHDGKLKKSVSSMNKKLVQLDLPYRIISDDSTRNKKGRWWEVRPL